MNHTRSRAILRTAVAAVALAAPAAARADSIVDTNVADFEIYAAAADGSAPVRLTAGGGQATPWRSPTQAHDGTVLALHGGALVPSDRAGRELGRTTPLGGDAGPVQGPWTPRISPDGQKVVYDVYVQTSYQTPGSILLDDGWWSITQDLASGAVLGNVKRYRQASWLGDSRTQMSFDELAGGNKQIATWTIGRDWNDVDQWLSDTSFPVGNGELTRAEDKAVWVQAPASNETSDTKGNFLSVYGIAGHADLNPGRQAEIRSASGERMRDPGWASDGRAIVWWEPGTGVYRTAFDGTQGSVAPQLVIAGGGQADIGPAERGPGSQVAAGPAPGGPTGAQPGGPATGGGGEPGTALRVRVPRRVRVAALRRGLLVRVLTPTPARAGVTVSDGRRRVGRARRRVAAGGGTVRVRLQAGPRRRLGRPGHRRLRVRVTVAGATTTRTVTVLR